MFDFNIDVEQGEFIVLVGPSGCGKSTLGMAIMRLLPKHALVTNGSIVFQNKNILDISDHEMRQLRWTKISMIFQEPMTALNPVLTCGEQMIETIMLHQQLSKKAATKEAIRLFTSVKINDPEKAIDKYPHELSGGQKQRVMIAMAMCCKPSLLICDEPTTALDVTIQAQILDLMGKLKSELGMSILFITHDLGLVREFSDTVSVMKDGKIVEQGNTQQIFDHPQNDYTKKLLDSEPLPKTDLLLETSSMVKVENLDIFYDIPSINFLRVSLPSIINNISKGVIITKGIDPI